MIRALILILCGAGYVTGAQAQTVTAAQNMAMRGDVTAFETCFINLMIDNPDSPVLEAFGPALCGERHIPMGQTCDPLDYLLFDRRAACRTADLAFWEGQVAARAAVAAADGRAGVGATQDAGLERCTDADDPQRCTIEVNWRTVMEFIAADLVADLVAGQP